MTKHIDTVIVGGGQAGLSVSYYLRQQHRRHVVLEQAHEAANTWRNHRWDSFTLNTPNWQSALPGMEYPGSDPDGFLSREEIAGYLERYVKRFHLPVSYGIHVECIHRNEGGTGYIVDTSAGRVVAQNVVVATGLYQFPNIPSLGARLSASIKQLHSDSYRNPQSLPPGAVLVVGSAQSGAQITEELHQAGRKVYLSVSRSGRVPRRYRGKDANEWHSLMGDYSRTVDQLPSPRAKFASKPHISGTKGGHTINLHQIARDGVTLLGRLLYAINCSIMLAGDLKENLASADKFEAEFVKSVDEYIAGTRIEAPEETLPQLRDGFQAEDPAALSLKDANISTVIWATGYRFDFGLVRFPVLDNDGYPIQKRGVTAFPGLYFVGLPWLHTAKSGLLFGLEQDASHIASAIADHSADSVTEAMRYAETADQNSRTAILPSVASLSPVALEGSRGKPSRSTSAAA